MSEPQLDRLAAARWEADRHALVLEEALAQWAGLAAPTDIAAIEADKNLRQLTDQILFRFLKLQDCMGERLTPATLNALLEPFEAWPMRDRLDRLETLGYLEVDDWLRWRELRNRLDHEYPDRPELRHSQLIAAVAGAAELLVAYRVWAAKLPANSA